MQHEVWTQKYRPKSEEDILISKPNYREIKAFFQNFFDSNLPKINNFRVPSVLIMFGPSGCGKNSTVDFLCQHFDVEKVTPAAIDINDGDDELENKEMDYPRDLLKVFQYGIFWANTHQKKIIVMQDLPDQIVPMYKKKLEDLASLYTKPNRKTIPIIFVLNSYIYNDTKLKQIFPEEFLKFHTKTIKMKGYSESSIKKVLVKIQQYEPRLAGIDMDSIKEEINLKSNGDLKSAINQLYLHSLKSGLYKSSKPRKIKSIQGTQYSQSSFNSLNSQMIIEESQDKVNLKDREFTLFHTLGKFLYNKRLDPHTNQSRMMSAEEIRSLKPKLYFEPEKMINQLCIDQTLFRIFLHENYLDFYGEIEDVVEMSQVFENMDVFQTINFNREKNEFEYYKNDLLNSVIIGTGIMLHNITGGDRLMNEKPSRGLKPLTKPRQFQIKREITNNLQNLKANYGHYHIGQTALVTEFVSYLQILDKYQQERERNLYTNKAFFLPEPKKYNSYSNSFANKFDEDDLILERDPHEEYSLSVNEVSLGQTEFTDRPSGPPQDSNSKLQKNGFVEDDIESPFD